MTALDDQTTQWALKHSGIGTGQAWENARKEIANGWHMGLESLKSTLETGFDLRVIQRPLIGIYPEEASLLTDLRREELAIEINYGALVTAIVPGYGADLAGIQPGDVLIAIDGKHVDRLKTLLAMLSDFQAGDQIHVEVLRRGKKHHFIIDAKAQQLSVFPDTPEEMAKDLEARSSKELEALE